MPSIEMPPVSWEDVKRRVAQRLMAANPQGTYDTPVEEPLYAIPVLQIELNGDGSIRRIDVPRRPSQGEETIALATEVLAHAAPFGDVSHLPKPWRFIETFLFNEDRKFKPRTLDE